MAFPIPIFAAEDWWAVWIFPAIMSVIFGVFLRDRDVVSGGDRRPMFQRFMSNFLLYSSVWIPFQVVGDAIERGAEAQGFVSPAGWGFGLGIFAGLIGVVALMAVSATSKPVQQWLGYDRNPFKIAGKS